MKKIILLAASMMLFVVSCKKTITKSEDTVENVSKKGDGFYDIDFENYPLSDSSLPIGVFDSGTGGLTVLKAIVAYDENNNASFERGSDGKRDFEKESFIYLADQANMPYGNYAKEKKTDLLKEHIIKDALFLMGRNYYSDKNDTSVNTDKQPIKVIVIACNTATAYGKEHLEDYMKKVGLDIKVIGVIDAGVRGALETIEKDENAIIGVLATVGTVSSKGYHNTILKMKEEEGYSGEIEIFSQGGLGIAEAIDDDPEYFDKNLKKPRNNYKGPSLDGDSKIDRTLLDIYNFDFTNSKMLCNSEKTDDCSILQINDAENYVRYHLVTLMEKIRLSKSNNTLKSIILGCTHYPYMTDEILMVLKELYNYKDKDGKLLYRNFMAQGIKLIDPAIGTAKELHEYLNKKRLFNPEGNIQDSEFYISVPNKDNPNNRIDENGRFPYDYKYGRNANQSQEYVKVVPFSRDNISDDILIRFQKQIPYIYELIQAFNKNNQKTKGLPSNDRI